jgi:lysophospholipase L1-like esterase
MKDNRLHEGLLLFVYTIFTLLVLSFLPVPSKGFFDLKEIRLLADIEKVPEPEQPEIPVVHEDPPAENKNLSCPEGQICLEDFSPDGKGLEKFITQLKQSGRRSARIGFYGDSFIEGDILTAGLRDTLQRIFGGRGQGFVPVYSEVAAFRNTIRHEFENLENKSIVGKYTSEPSFGPSGQVVRALEENFILYRPGKNAQRLEAATLLYAAESDGKLSISLNDTLENEITLLPEKTLGHINLSAGISTSLKISLNAADSVDLYGMVFEGPSGIYVDNLAMRGNSGLGLTRIPASKLTKLNQIRPYHLIVLQFGLNVVAENDSTDYAWYVAGMRRVISHFQKAFPESSILLIGISDRSINVNGAFKTLPGILRMRTAQRKIAEQSGILFWDLFEAMGGENSMPKFASAQPPMAGKDHTHLNSRGGQVMAGKLAKALLFEMKQYEKPADRR